MLANDSSFPDIGEQLTIVNVGVTSDGGVVQLASDSRSLVYRPANGFTGTETFTYTIADENGDQATATVRVQVQADTRRVGFIFEVVGQDGLPIETIQVGQTLPGQRVRAGPAGRPGRCVFRLPRHAVYGIHRRRGRRS